MDHAGESGGGDGLGALQRAQLEAVYNAIDDGLVVFDPQGKVLVVNDAEARLCGYPTPAAMMRDLAYFAEVFALFELDGTSLPVEAWPVSRVLRGERVSGLEILTRRLDTGAELIIRFSGEPVRDAAGAIAYGVVISSDVTERTRREQALRTSEERFRALADSMPQLVWTARRDGTVDYYNERSREYAGLGIDGDGRWHWQPALHPDDLAATVTAWLTAVDAGATYACEHRVQMADGAFRWHISRAHLVPHAAGDRWFGTATDIHEQKLAEEQLRRAVAMRNQVVSVVSHDLRNPLGVVRMILPALHDTLEAIGTPEVRERTAGFLARLDRQVAKMGKLLDELLDVARLQANQPLELDRRPCDLVVLVRDLLEEQTTSVPTHTFALHAHVASLRGQWDAPRVDRVLGNLLSNAVKYSPSGSEIDVDIAAEQEHAVVRVIDRGLGIAPDDRARIFDWFTRGENAQKAARGIGVGLAGARRIAEQHGGTLSVESELGAGSTFTLRLPLR